MGSPPPSSTPEAPESRETLTYDTGPPPPGRPRPQVALLERGSAVDRYIILDLVGQGGMGVVYAAYDPSLDRRVALKFLQESDHSGVRESRLLREAQAMARLSHPNVLVAYEVGRFGGQVFLAMEFIDGVDLHRWLAAEPRSPSRILEVFRAAGRGLAAAHAAGIVHRDFKPENVLIGADDRPRVTDFGLSRASPDPDGDETEAPIDPGIASVDPLSTPSHLSIQLTRTGGLVGTPGYMPPEQYRGIEADARVDQFGFCVALCEALTGALPFRGDTPEEIVSAMVGRRIDPAASAMPRWVRPVVMRGLEPEPRDRWPNMDALLEALSRDPGARRRRWLVAGGAGIALVAAASIWLASREEVQACPPAQGRIAGIWDAAARKPVRDAFLATGAERAADVFARAERALDARLTGWVEAHREACRATRVRGEQSEALLDLRMQCLERSRRKIEALPAVWREGVELDEAVRAAMTAGDVEACSDAAALTTPVPRPSQPDAAKRLQALERRLDRLDAIRRAGRLEAGLKEAREAVEEARRLAYAPALAEALHRNGQIEADFGSMDTGIDLLHQAFEAANRAHDDARAATAMRLLLFYSVWSDKRLADADLLWKMAEAATARVPDRDDLTAQLLATQGAVLAEQGKHAEAAERLRRAIALERKLHGDDDFPVAPWLYGLAAALADLGQTDEALALNERARAAWERTLGAEHPAVAEALSNLALLLVEKGDPDAAAVQSERALSIRSQIFPADHPNVAKAVYNLAQVRREQDRDEEARVLFERAARIREKALGPEHPMLASALNQLADLAVRRGDAATARRLMDRALPIKIKTYGEEHTTVAFAMQTLGDLHLLEKDAAAARAAYQRSLAIHGKQGPERPNIVPALTGLGRAQLAAGQLAEAVATLERAVAKADAGGPAARIPGARSRFQLARALWATGDRARAATQARAARDLLAGRREGDEIDRWLLEHAPR